MGSKYLRAMKEAIRYLVAYDWNKQPPYAMDNTLKVSTFGQISIKPESAFVSSRCGRTSLPSERAYNLGREPEIPMLRIIRTATRMNGEERKKITYYYDALNLITVTYRKLGNKLPLLFNRST